MYKNYLISRHLLIPLVLKKKSTVSSSLAPLPRRRRPRRLLLPPRRPPPKPPPQPPPFCRSRLEDCLRRLVGYVLDGGADDEDLEALWLQSQLMVTMTTFTRGRDR
ncbi:hypothetical protein RHGRI_016874 [Rhododendron griersonianum]|uniref:Uncharacterized protein n=1 Tax=Rhododendron griersonianum TaxID=479676 RepID=A0AAV6JVP1_9ERIC|nr:hypothetical protein RHGRI_016874 [Rhododendron griersonianum]